MMGLGPGLSLGRGRRLVRASLTLANPPGQHKPGLRCLSHGRAWQLAGGLETLAIHLERPDNEHLNAKVKTFPLRFAARDLRSKALFRGKLGSSPLRLSVATGAELAPGPGVAPQAQWTGEASQDLLRRITGPLLPRRRQPDSRTKEPLAQQRIVKGLRARQGL